MLEFNGTAIVLAISFVIFVLLENFIFYRPLKKVIKERTDYIRENENLADKSYCAAKTLVEQKDKKISQAKAKSAEILNNTNIQTQEKFDSAIKEAKLNSNKHLEDNKNKLDEESISAQNALKKEIGVYASDIISKILRKDVSVVNVSDEVVEKAMRGEL